MSKRIITEGTWSGYTGSQAHIVHRTIHNGKSPFRYITAIQFTDGTTLGLVHRPAKPRERVAVIDGYTEALWKFRLKGMKGFCRISDLYKEGG
jgi:hypothetical protein